MADPNLNELAQTISCRLRDIEIRVALMCGMTTEEFRLLAEPGISLDHNPED